MVNRDGKSAGIAPHEYPAFRERLMDDLRGFRDPESGEPVVTGIWTREEAFAGPEGSLAPDLTLALRDGGLVSILPSEQPLVRRPMIAGAHRPVGIFAARGPGIRKGAQADELSILDVAPTVLYSLGVPIPEQIQGRVPEEIYEPAALQLQPVERASTVPAGNEVGHASNGVTPTISPEDEQVVLERLRELGYIE